MESKHESSKIITTILVALVLLIACSRNNEKGEVSKDSSLSSYDDLSFRDGDIICRLGTGFFSKMFRDRASKDSIYSHVGVVELSQDSIFVIHVEASELTGVGFVQKESIETFLYGVKTWGVYRINCSDSIASKIIGNANIYLDKKAPFDLDFDTFNDSAVYCTELVALAVNQAMDSSLIVPSMNIGTKVCYSLDDIYEAREMSKIY